MPRRQSLRDRKTLIALSSPPSPRIATARPRRAAATSNATIARELSDDEGNDGGEAQERRQTLRLTVKMPSSRLREATSVASLDAAPVASTRSTRNIKKSYVVETSSEDEEEDEEPEDYADADANDDEIAEEATPNPRPGEEDGDGDDAEAEIDADGDIEMDDDADDGVPLGYHPPPPILKVNPPAAPKTKPAITVKAAPNPTKLKSVEAKEMSMNDPDEDDDEELSELGSDDDDDEEEADEDDDAAEGEEDAEGEDIDEEEDDEMAEEGDYSRSPDALSRGTTPDINKMTKRQRSRLNEVYTASTSPSADTGAGAGAGGGRGGFLELPMEPQVKKHLTAEEHAMRRAEMARRRKNLSEKRNEEEKQDTINRLLKKQAPKRRGKISAKEIEAQDRGDMSEAEEQALEEVEVRPANPVFVRWVSDRRGCRVGVPVEWLGTPMGEVFGGGGGGNGSGKMVEEVEG